MKRNLLPIAAGLVLAFSNSAFAQAADLAGDATPSVSIGAPAAIAELKGVPAAPAPAMIASSIVVSPTQPGLPCFACAPSPTPLTFSIGASVPTGYIPLTEPNIQFAMVYETLSASGSCSVVLAIMQGTKALYTASGTPTLAVNTIYLQPSANIARQSTWHGAATGVGTVKCGATIITASTNLYFQ